MVNYKLENMEYFAIFLKNTNVIFCTEIADTDSNFFFRHESFTVLIVGKEEVYKIIKIDKFGNKSRNLLDNYVF